MTSNEQRAHDLAIASIPIIYEGYKSQILRQQQNGETKSEYKFDIYSEYLKAYNKALESFNRDFSDDL